MLAWVLETTLRLSHPFMPFVSETIWQTLPWRNDLLIKADWPNTFPEYSEISAGEFIRLQKLIVEARYVTAELPGNKRYRLLYENDSLIEDNANLVKSLAKLQSVSKVEQAQGLRLAVSGREAWLDIDADTLYEHQHNLEIRLAETRQHIQTLESRLKNESYTAKAPSHLVEESRQQLKNHQALEERLVAELKILA